MNTNNQSRAFKTQKGAPYPFGVSYQPNLTNFSLVSPQATKVSLCLFTTSHGTLVDEIVLSPEENKTGDVWHIAIENCQRDLLYAYLVTPKLQLKQEYLLDSYAKEVYTGYLWGTNPNYLPLGVTGPVQPFDWEDDKPPHIPVEQLIIYEMHVRGFTQHPSGRASDPGTYLGLIEKIPHLTDLGINAVELLPVQEFNEMEFHQMHPHIKNQLYNYWGYSTVNFFAPMARYASSLQPGSAISEFKAMVKALHKQNIKVILDIVFNHTAEGDKRGPLFSYKGFDNSDYYMLDKHGNYFNFSGCGNTFNANHPITQELIIQSLRYWVTEMHVDGFRFDLASALTRGCKGEPLNSAPLIEAITHDPILRNTLLISEPWDAAGLYQVGSFAPQTLRWHEWNGKYRDCVRKFIKGQPGVRGEFAMRLSGSEDLYSPRAPFTSINFVTAHDGFTLNDLVSYNKKHNMDNGEHNHDGTNDNESWNCGVEGKTSHEHINLLRQRQMRNFHLALMISQGIPMLHMGDEYGHSKGGNNNTWCHDSSLNWFLWDKLSDNRSFYRFYRAMIHFRKKNHLLQRTSFLTANDVDWHGSEPFKADWDHQHPFIAYTLKDPSQHRDLYAAFNAQNNSVRVTLPKPSEPRQWRFVVNTANLPPSDYYDEGNPCIIDKPDYVLEPHSAILLEAVDCDGGK